jgi:hypothetical protein
MWAGSAQFVASKLKDGSDVPVEGAAQSEPVQLIKEKGKKTFPPECRSP